MNSSIQVALLVLAGGAMTMLGNYLMNKRQINAQERVTSGTISTSDAASLWAESNALRAEYKERAERLEAQLEEVNRKLQSVMEEMTKLQTKGDKMIGKIDELKKIIAKLRKENARLLAQKKEIK